MKKKMLIVIFSLLIVFSLASCNDEIEQKVDESDFWENTEDSYDVNYEVVTPSGDVMAAIGKAMIEKNCSSTVQVEFHDSEISLYYTFLSDSIQGLSIKVEEDWVEGEKKESVVNNVVYEFRLEKEKITENIALKTYVPKMKMNVEYNIKLDIENTKLLNDDEDL